MTKEEYKKEYTEDDAPGWLYIDNHLDELYNKVEPRHYSAKIPLMLGGEDPLDAISIYDSKKQFDHLHLISYGMSSLYYDEDSVGEEYSKWGFEFTMRLKPLEDENQDPFWAINMMNNLGKYVFESNCWFENNHFIPANGPIRLDKKTNLVGLVFVNDPELEKINTPHGEVSFIQIFGINQKELDRLEANPSLEEVSKFIEEVKKDNPLLITDLIR